MCSMLSIIVTVYNVDKYLFECRFAIEAWDVGYEIILLDDDSQEDSGRICGDYSLKDI